MKNNKGNKKLNVYVIYNLQAKKYQVPPRRYSPPKISKQLTPWRIYHFKIPQSPLYQGGSYPAVMPAKV